MQCTALDSRVHIEVQPVNVIEGGDTEGEKSSLSHFSIYQLNSSVLVAFSQSAIHINPQKRVWQSIEMEINLVAEV